MKCYTARHLALALFSTGVLSLSLAPVASASAGGNSESAKLCQKGGWQNLYSSATGTGFSNDGACVSFGAQGGEYSSLVVTPTDNGDTTWGDVSGFGLEPGLTVSIVGNLNGAPINPIEMKAVFPDGTIFSHSLGLACASSWSDVFATGTTSLGATITTPAVNPPCA